MTLARWAVGSDHAAVALRSQLAGWLRARGAPALEVGPASSEEKADYPDIAHDVARRLAAREIDLAVLVCGSGVGMSIAANRHAGVRAVVCTEAYSAEMARRHNDANVLCLGARVVGPGLAESILQAFVGASFEGGRHAPRVEKIEMEP